MPTRHPWHLTKPRPMHFKAAELAALGHGRREIARALGVSKWQVSRWLHSPAFQELVAAAAARLAAAQARASLPPAWQAANARLAALDALREIACSAGSKQARVEAARAIFMRADHLTALVAQHGLGNITNCE